MEGYLPSTYGDRFAEVYDDWYADVTDVDACTTHLVGLVDELGGGPLLELGVGSGRLALPLVAHGVTVHGIDASEAMVARLRAKPGGSSVQVSMGDMAELPLAGAPLFVVVLAAFNTFFNLPNEAQQRQCLGRIAAALAPEGRFVIEAFVPRDNVATGSTVTARHVTTDEVVLSVSQVDPSAQTITGQHVHLRESGIRLRPWHLRYATPDQLDVMAADAGLELESRHGGWNEEPFTSESGVHVSRYRRGNVRSVRDQPSAPPR
ncbi:MAG: class I SAM-dependent methyltransferase [Acidimicrobiales bacterium]